MAKLRIDLRKTLRAIATACQIDNATRLLTGQTVKGGEVDPKKPVAKPSVGRRARLRVFGVRVALADFAGRLGIASGAMLRDLTKKSNIKVGRVAFKIIPSPDVILRWRVFNAGSPKQAARPVGGVSAQRLREGGSQIARASRDQFVQALRDRQK